MTKHDFYSLFTSKAEAKSYEKQALAQARLPMHAQAVRDGGKVGPEYWTWLCNQAAQDGFMP